MYFISSIYAAFLAHDTESYTLTNPPELYILKYNQCIQSGIEQVQA